MIKEHIIQPVLKAIGYYAVKSKWRKQQMINRFVQEDKKRIEKLQAEILAINTRILPVEQKKNNLTVSLTSHGRRVEQYAAYAIYSVMTQVHKPNRVVLNINRDKWSEDNLPELIKKLQIAGLEVNFCEDVGPHTKLLPTLQKYPDDVIITVDDDLYYGPQTIQILYDEFAKSDGITVICHGAYEIKRDEKGKLLPYSQWTDITQTEEPAVGKYSPLGFRSVLYPPHVFSDEVFNQKIYRTICPKADDIWFTIMEIHNQVAVKPVVHADAYDDDLDHRNEFEAQGSDALHFSNDSLGQNDVQLKALCEHYEL